MSDAELKKRLITSIQRSRDSALLREAFRLMGTDASELEPYSRSERLHTLQQQTRWPR